MHNIMNMNHKQLKNRTKFLTQ